MSRPSSRYVVIDIGGTKIAAGIAHVDDTGHVAITHRTQRATPAADGGAAVLDAVTTAACDVAAAARVDGVTPHGVGVASAGVVSPTSGDITYASDLMPGWGGTRLREGLARKLGLPVAVLNDVHAHALGESRVGAGRDVTRFLLLAAGTGLGGALVTAHGIDTGHLGVAGSLAHLIHPLAAGMTCACGATTGHIECVVSGTGQAALYNRNPPQGTSPATGGGDVFTRYRTGDPHARDTLLASGRALGQTLASAAALLDPEKIVLTGSATRCGEEWWQVVREAFRADALPLHRNLAIAEGLLAGDAPLTGAAIAAHTACTRDITKEKTPTPSKDNT